MMHWKDALGQLLAEDLKAIHSQWLPGKVPAKAACLSAVIDALTPPKRLIAQLTPVQQCVLAHAERHAAARYTLVAVAAGAGSADAPGEVRKLVSWGALIPEYTRSVDTSFVLAPAFTGCAMRGPPLRLKPVAVPNGMETWHGDAEAVHRAIWAVHEGVRGAPAGLTRGGSLTVAELRRLTGSLPGLPWDLAYVLWLAQRAGWFVADHRCQRLVVGTPLPTRVADTVAALLDQACADVLPPRSTKVQFPYSLPAAALEPRVGLRWLLARMTVGGWYSVTDLVRTLVANAPALGAERYWHNRDYESTPKLAANQAHAAAVALTCTFVALGVCDATSQLPARASTKRELPDWGEAAWVTPDLAGWAVRLTPSGRVALGIDAEAPLAPGDPAGIHIGSNFEIIVPKRCLPTALESKLDVLAKAAPVGAADAVRRWQLDRTRWLAAAQGGVDGLAVLRQVAGFAGKAIPDNVVATLEGWQASLQRATVYLGFDGLHAPGAAVSGARSVAVRPGLWVVPEGSVKGDVVAFDRWTLCVQASPEDRLLPVRSPSLVEEVALAKVADREENGQWRLSRKKLRGADVDETLAVLGSLCGGVLTAGVVTRVRGWSGTVQARRVRASLVLLPEGVDAEGVSALPEVAPHVLGNFGAQALWVRPKAEKALARALAEMGVFVSDTAEG